METFFWSLLLAAISGLTYVAYKHPKAFEMNIAYPLIGLAIFGVTFITGWNSGGITMSVKNLVEEVSRLKIENSRIELSVQQINDSHNLEINTLIIGGAVIIYLLLLINLPKLLSIDKNEKNNDS